MIWVPADEEQLREALDKGVLTERHTLEFKSKLEDSKGANKELARDLAQFAIDGGTLIIGVAEAAAGGPPSLSPVDLDGLKERVDQVARSVPDPPLEVRTDTVPTVDDPARGYLLVTVPSTPYVPRQVDGVYYGRGDTTRYRLPAAEVERCYQLGVRIQRDINLLLDEAEANDPWPAPARRHAHLFAVAQPVSPRSDLLLRALGPSSQKWTRFLHTEFRQPLEPDWAPDLTRADTASRRAWGWAVSSVDMPGRVVDTSNERTEARLLDLEVREDGGLRLYCGRASDTYDRNRDPVEIVLEGVIVGLTKRLVMAAATIADTTGFLGSWDLGVSVTGLRGLISGRLTTTQTFGGTTPFSEDGYRQTIRVAHEQLDQEPDAIVEALTGRLNRALGSTPPVPSA